LYRTFAACFVQLTGFCSTYLCAFISHHYHHGQNPTQETLKRYASRKMKGVMQLKFDHVFLGHVTSVNSVPNYF